MKVLVQRSNNASCTVDSKLVSKIDSGLVLFVGFTNNDDGNIIDYMVNKVINLRIFEDENNVMNKSILDYGGEILSISQFTLYGDASDGNRPSYINAMKSKDAINLYNEFNNILRNYGIVVETGKFGALMEVNIINDGPTTIWLESRKK